MCAFSACARVPLLTIVREIGRNARRLYGYSMMQALPWISTDQDLLYSRGSDHGLHLWYSFRKHNLSGNRTHAKGIEGGFNIMRYGAGPSGPMRTLGQYMLGSGLTFGYVTAGPCHSRRSARRYEFELMLIVVLLDSFFMSIGSVIRTEGNSPLASEAFARARRQPLVLPRRYARKPEHGEGEQ